jgi:hypothetical protein
VIRTLLYVVNSAHFWVRSNPLVALVNADINTWLVKRPERTGPHVSGPGGRPSLRGVAASGAAAQERGPHRGTVWSLHADQRSAVIRRRFPSATAAWMFAQATITQKAQVSSAAASLGSRPVDQSAKECAWGNGGLLQRSSS